MRPAVPDVVVRPRHGDTTLTIGPAFVTVAGTGVAAGTWTRGRTGQGRVARLRAYVSDAEPTDRLPEVHRLSVLDGQANVLTALPWNGADHDGLESACASVRMPLDRVPESTPRHTGPPVVVPAEAARYRSGPLPALEVGHAEVVVDDADGGRRDWPRLGHVPPDRPAVARLRIDLGPAGEDGRRAVLRVALVAVGGRVLTALSWPHGELDPLRRACAALGLLTEYGRVSSEPAALPIPDSPGAGALEPAGSRLPVPRSAPGYPVIWLVMYATLVLAVVGLTAAVIALSQ